MVMGAIHLALFSEPPAKRTQPIHESSSARLTILISVVRNLVCAEVRMRMGMLRVESVRKKQEVRSENENQELLAARESQKA